MTQKSSEKPEKVSKFERIKKFLSGRNKLAKEIAKRRKWDKDYDVLCTARHNKDMRKIELEMLEIDMDMKDLKIESGDIPAPKVEGFQDMKDLIAKDPNMSRTHKAIWLGAIQFIGPMLLQAQTNKTNKVQISQEVPLNKHVNEVSSPGLSDQSPPEFNVYQYLEKIPEQYHKQLALMSVPLVQSMALEKGYKLTDFQAEKLINAAKQETKLEIQT